MTHDSATDALGYLTPLASEDPGMELSRLDIATLVELADLTNVGNLRSPLEPKKRGDPAGCSHAWVYTPA